MKINELKAKENASIEADVKEVEDSREVMTRYGKKVKVTNVILEDETGDVKLTVWGEEIDNIKVGNRLKITDGWVNEFKGDLQISLGKNGKMEVI